MIPHAGNDLDDDAASIITEDHRYQMSGALNASTTSVATRHTKNDRDSRTSNEPLHTTMRSIQPQHQNWLLRFLHIKPATKVLCFQVSKFKARKEIVSLLREWRKYGMRDVVVDKVAGRVWARVAEKNSMYPPFQFHPIPIPLFHSSHPVRTSRHIHHLPLPPKQNPIQTNKAHL